jgi:hypothetical protein
LENFDDIRIFKIQKNMNFNFKHAKIFPTFFMTGRKAWLHLMLIFGSFETPVVDGT